jgi:hypothetical protein
VQNRKTLGLLYAETGQRDKAIEQLESAVELDATDEEARQSLTMLRKGRR